MFKFVAQIAQADDHTDDCTSLRAEDRELVDLVEVRLDRVLNEEESLKIQQQATYDPISRIKGVKPSDDPMLEMRAAMYLISGKQTRDAKVWLIVEGMVSNDWENESMVITGVFTTAAR